MSARSRPAFTLFQLLTVLALLAIAFGLFLPAVAKVRLAAARMQSTNNLKQIGIAAFSYHDANQFFPPGCDANNFSAAAYLLPYIEQANVYQMIDFKKPMDDKANAAARKTQIRTFLNPMDGVKQSNPDFGATNYLFNAGSKPDLKDGDGVYFLESKVKVVDITDGTSQTMMAAETLRGDGGEKADDVRRQYVLLKEGALKGIKDDAGTAFWKEGQNIAGDRCACWMDGRFLQGTFNTRLGINDERPDVSCAGLGGVSSMRCVQDGVNAAMCDGSVRFVSKAISIKTWRAVSTRAEGVVPGSDF